MLRILGLLGATLLLSTSLTFLFFFLFPRDGEIKLSK